MAGPPIPEDDFATLARRVGLDPDAHPMAELRAAFGHLEEMVLRVKRPLGTASDRVAPSAPGSKAE